VINQTCGGYQKSCQLYAWQALLESVDGWPMVIIIHKTIGGKPKPVAAYSGVTGGRHPPPEGYMLYFGMAPSRLISCISDHPLGNAVGAIG
jgi:hypothetical protein